MTKTAATIELENALDAYSEKKREYGCREITIGFHYEGHGDEIVDYMTMDGHSVFRCYELKVSLSDLKTDNKKSFYGDYNYLVVSEDLYRKNPVWDNWIPPYCGILYGKALKVVRNAKKKRVDDTTREMLKDSLIRTLYWKMKDYQNADNLEGLHEMQRRHEKDVNSLEEKLKISDRKVWTYDDYEHYYRLNHQIPSFKISDGAKEERRQYSLRKEGKFVINQVCPVCGRTLQDDEKWCPACGTDLRKLK